MTTKFNIGDTVFKMTPTWNDKMIESYTVGSISVNNAGSISYAIDGKNRYQSIMLEKYLTSNKDVLIDHITKIYHSLIKELYKID